jgi:hypothetical protein
MKSALKLMTLALASYLIMPAAQAADKATFDVPFAFTVAGSTFPAGSYDVQRDAGKNLVTLKSIDSQKAIMRVGYAVQTLRMSPDCKLKFHKYGDSYYLSSVWMADTNTGTELPKSKAEREHVARSAGVVLVAGR